MPARFVVPLFALSVLLGTASASDGPLTRAEAWRHGFHRAEVFLPRLRAAAEAGDLTAQVALGEVLVWPEVLRGGPGVTPPGPDLPPAIPEGSEAEGLGWIRKAYFVALLFL